MAIHYLHHGGAGTQHPDRHLYPAAVPPPVERLAPAAHKEPVAFGITRLLDFSQADGRRQAGLQQYLEHTASAGAPLQAGDLLTLSALPAHSMLVGYAWGVEEPEAGVSLTLRLLRTDLELESLSASTVDSRGRVLTMAPWLTETDWLTAELTAFPAKGATQLRFWVSPIVLAPQLGN